MPEDAYRRMHAGKRCRAARALRDMHRTAPVRAAIPHGRMAAWRDKGDGQAFPHKPRALTGRWPGV